MRVMASYANPVFPGVFDWLAGMNSGIQLFNHIVMAARTLIEPVEVIERFINSDRVRMKALFGGISVAFKT
jgi:hypothetical protein